MVQYRVMPRPGHANDCPACLYASLPEADQRLFYADDFAAHVSQEPPEPPARPDWACLPVVVGIVLAVAGHSIAVLAAFGGLVGAGGALVWIYLFWRWETLLRQWAILDEQWMAVQTQEWLQRRAQGLLWPCPTCAKLSCSNQHSVTHTETRRGLGGVYGSVSWTDPR